MLLRSVCKTIIAKNNKQVLLRRLDSNDFEKLALYLEELSTTTKTRFGPHSFNLEGINRFYRNENKYMGYIATDTETNDIVAYSIIKYGCLQHDVFRLQSYGLIVDDSTDFSFAPSVADAWQNFGIGQALLHFIITDIKWLGVKRMLLWGGVQADNTNAIHYYEKNNFKKLGIFKYKGYNYDMALNIE